MKVTYIRASATGLWPITKPKAEPADTRPTRDKRPIRDRLHLGQDGLYRPYGSVTIIRPELHRMHPHNCALNHVTHRPVIGPLLESSDMPYPVRLPLPDALPDWLTDTYGKARRKAR